MYTVETEEIKNGEGYWSYLLCKVMRDGVQIGEYQRNYASLYNTFFPFHMNGRDLALYSPRYTATRLMSLPDCTDIGGEEASGGGFCPVDFYVPSFTECTLIKIGDESDLKKPYKYQDVDPEPEELISTNDGIYDTQVGPLQYREFGFVAGCVWGDDTSWKIEYLDLSRAHEGILVREAKLGYVHLPSKMSLKDAISTELVGFNGLLKVATERFFDLKTGEWRDD